MTYIDKATVNGTLRIPGAVEDFYTVVALLEEKWSLFFPSVEWYPLDWQATVATDIGEANAMGVPAKTQVDTLYGEPVPVTAGGVFLNPHSNPAGINANVRRVWKPPADIHVKFDRQQEDKPSLTMFGDDQQRYAVVDILCSSLDKNNMVVNQGDKFVYENRTWDVITAQIPTKGRYRSTNIPLFVRCGVQVKISGS